MPTTLESALVLLVLLAPGFIAVRIKNSLLPYRPPSAFQETVEAAILSALLLPVWLVFGRRFLNARQHLMIASTTLAPLDIWTLFPVAGVIVLIYVVISPLLGVLYALIQANPPYSAATSELVRGRLGVHAHPLVPLPGVPESLIRLDSDGQLLDDLTSRAEGVWVEIGPEVLFVEVFG